MAATGTGSVCLGIQSSSFLSVQGVSAKVRGGSSTANLLEPQHHRASKVGTSSGLLKHSEPQRTYRKHTTTELALCVGGFCTKSGWFKHSEPTRTTPSQSCVGCLGTSSGWFKHSEPQRTYTSLTSTELARCVGYFCTRAGWFKHFEPLRTYTNHTFTELARCVGCFCTSSGGSSTSNLHEPHPHS